MTTQAKNFWQKEGCFENDGANEFSEIQDMDSTINVLILE